MASSPPNKLFPNQSGFPTPNAAPEEVGCRSFSIPSDEEWFALLMGALDALRQPYNWYQNGTMTQEEAAAAFADILDQAYENECGGSGEIPAPYWDTPEDSDDEAEADVQPWYGIFDGEFHEVIENWAIAGFIAYAGAPGAALTFLTLAPKFRLAWKTGDLGGVIRIFIDSADAGTVDTYSAEPGSIEKEFIADPEEEEHRILMVLESVP